MKAKEDHQHRLKEVLTETITLLCKNGLQFKEEFSVDALIGITLDKEEIVLVNIKEICKFSSEKDSSFSSEKPNSENSDLDKSLLETVENNTLLNNNDNSSVISTSNHQSPDIQNNCNTNCNNFKVTQCLQNTHQSLQNVSGSCVLNANMTETGTNARPTTVAHNLEIKQEIGDPLYSDRNNDCTHNKDKDIVFIKEEHFNTPSSGYFPNQMNYNDNLNFISGSHSQYMGSAGFPPHSYMPGVNWSYPYHQQELPQRRTLNNQQVNCGTLHNSKTAPNSQFRCEPCGKSYANSRGLWRHKQVEHLRCTGAVCPQCNKSFTRKDHMLRHLRSEHLKIGSVSCAHCSKIFYRKDKLNKHIERCSYGTKPKDNVAVSSSVVSNSSQKPNSNLGVPPLNGSNLLLSSFYQNLDGSETGYHDTHIRPSYVHNNPVFPTRAPYYHSANNFSTPQTNVNHLTGPNVITNRNGNPQGTNNASGGNGKQNMNLNTSPSQKETPFNNQFQSNTKETNFTSQANHALLANNSNATNSVSQASEISASNSFESFDNRISNSGQDRRQVNTHTDLMYLDIDN